MPSTMENITDLLNDTKHTTNINKKFSKLCMFYQAALFISTILLTIPSALRTVF
jgi:hypothetical protein